MIRNTLLNIFNRPPNTLIRVSNESSIISLYSFARPQALTSSINLKRQSISTGRLTSNSNNCPMIMKNSMKTNTNNLVTPNGIFSLSNEIYNSMLGSFPIFSSIRCFAKKGFKTNKSVAKRIRVRGNGTLIR